MAYEDVYRRSIEQPEAFWGEEAKAIHWHVPPQQVLDYSTPPFRRWFVGGHSLGGVRACLMTPGSDAAGLVLFAASVARTPNQ